MTSIVMPEPRAADPVAALDTVIADVIAPNAAGVDETGAFPREGVDALARAGVLGLLSAPDAGGLADAARVVERLAGACGSTAMVVLMHYAATSVLEAHGPAEVRRAIAAGEHLVTLALSETGSRSHFWAPVGTATPDGTGVRLDARKSFVTSAGEADGLVWSSRPLAAPGPMTLWYVPSGTSGLTVDGPFDGLGLRGNASSPVTADGVRVPPGAMLGADGAGLDLALGTALPPFLVLSAAFSLGVMEALMDAARDRMTRTRFEHLGRTLADDPGARAAYARLRVRVDGTRAFLADTLTALGTGRDDATTRVLQVKAVAGEAAAEVADGVLRLCGGSAFRRGTGVERRFRDALASRVMAPTTEALHDFVARADLGLPLFGEENRCC
ncbi:acyl-CoA dehydrogenase family protein [Actinomadura algeriensis]|uniref:Alkylation response protein AidB-like acyl-CoA dehydrogenase n=1 Tax=Actinomadura algeriensis TaxID=1679523 RepID=A0ABR9K5B1_9ACTN|nr:acyl-CoA dehydrogenase family protein [Actinomadura algeriensis]MBE1537585.1 alkylation response protein AidB-like acyl-CoA dehydrogenase [Actinomadura algeriensis]